MYFSQTAFPERYTLDALESDLQKKCRTHSNSSGT